MVIEILVIGAGVVGLACAARLSEAGHRVLVLERNPGVGRETTSRNSEVIHAGLYYPPGSLKALCCVEGRQDLYARCARYQIPHRKLGKFLVATNEEEGRTLEGIADRARANGAGDLAWVDAQGLSRTEPRVRACTALWSPESGIVDALALTRSYWAQLEANAGEVALRSALVGLERAQGHWSARVECEPDRERIDVVARIVVNAAGLESAAVAALAGIDLDRAGYRTHLCKGDYLSVAPELGVLTRHLVYPVPVPGGLGTHVTVDLGGRFRLGPDVEYVPSIDYRVDPGKAECFAEAVRRYLPEIRAEHLAPDFAGIRPKLQAPGEAFRDFVIEEGTAHGAPGLINLMGIESPGLTASSAIARRVCALVAAS